MLLECAHQVPESKKFYLQEWVSTLPCPPVLHEAPIEGISDFVIVAAIPFFAGIVVKHGMNDIRGDLEAFFDLDVDDPVDDAFNERWQ